MTTPRSFYGKSFKMMKLKHYFFLVTYIIIVNKVLADSFTCRTPNDSCKQLNVLLAPCSFNIDFNGSFPYINSVGVDAIRNPTCVCNKEFYSYLVDCGRNCHFPVDSPIQFESDCKDLAMPVDVNGDGGFGNQPPTPTSVTPSNTPASLPSISSSKVKTIAGTTVAVVLVMLIIFGVTKYCRKNHANSLPTQHPSPMIINNTNGNGNRQSYPNLAPPPHLHQQFPPTPPPPPPQSYHQQPYPHPNHNPPTNNYFY